MINIKAHLHQPNFVEKDWSKEIIHSEQIAIDILAYLLPFIYVTH
jgi:hypothetical protein